MKKTLPYWMVGLALFAAVDAFAIIDTAFLHEVSKADNLAQIDNAVHVLPTPKLSARVLIILAEFNDIYHSNLVPGTEDLTEDNLKDKFFNPNVSVNEALVESTYGQMNIKKVVVTPWVNIGKNFQDPNPDMLTWINAAKKAAKALDPIKYNSGDYEYVYIITAQKHPKWKYDANTFTAANPTLTYTTKSAISIFVNGPHADAWMFGHEFGHALGLDHFGDVNCQNEDITKTLSTCIKKNYGPQTFMGGGAQHTLYSAVQKNKINFLFGPLGVNFYDNRVQKIDTSGRYTLARSEDIFSGGFRAAKIVVPNSDRRYWLEYRGVSSGPDHDTLSPSQALTYTNNYVWVEMPYNGVAFPAQPGDYNAQEGAGGGYAPDSVSLKFLNDQDGKKKFVDKDNHITITVISTGLNSAVVDVKFENECIPFTPTPFTGTAWTLGPIPPGEPNVYYDTRIWKARSIIAGGKFFEPGNYYIKYDGVGSLKTTMGTTMYSVFGHLMENEGPVPVVYPNKNLDYDQMWSFIEPVTSPLFAPTWGQEIDRTRIPSIDQDLDLSYASSANLPIIKNFFLSYQYNDTVIQNYVKKTSPPQVTFTVPPGANMQLYYSTEIYLIPPGSGVIPNSFYPDNGRSHLPTSGLGGFPQFEICSTSTNFTLPAAGFAPLTPTVMPSSAPSASPSQSPIPTSTGAPQVTTTPYPSLTRPSYTPTPSGMLH